MFTILKKGFSWAGNSRVRKDAYSGEPCFD